MPAWRHTRKGTIVRGIIHCLHRGTKFRDVEDSLLSAVGSLATSASGLNQLDPWGGIDDEVDANEVP